MTDDELRQRLVDRLVRNRVLTDDRIRSALLRVPRHRFVPSVSLEDAYEDRAISIKEREGVVMSSISQPGMIVQMLALLEVERGQTILEIGTGSGYNAALLAELAGPGGSVVSVDIEPDLIEAARAHLRELHYDNVRVDDASALGSMTTPFDRIIVTARAEDIDVQWWRLLKDRGRLVVPLAIGFGGERAVGFVREAMLLRSVGSYACAFIRMRTGSEGAQSDVFFPNKNARYEGAFENAAFEIVAVERNRATPAIMDDADVVVARPATIFALRLTS